MKYTKLEIDGVWIINSTIHHDVRGTFQEWFKYDDMKEFLDIDFKTAQANLSYSHKNTLRGLHFSTLKEGQAKIITCVSGSIYDVIVDLRPNSKTFGLCTSFNLESKSGNSILVSEGLGHGFISLEDNTAVSYLVSSKYSPENEHSINPLDQTLAIDWPSNTPIISQRDLAGYSFQEFLNKLNDEN